MSVPFPEIIDATIVAAFRDCPQRAFLEYLQHYKTKHPSVHLVAGGAFAKGVEVARDAYHAKGDSPDVAVAKGLKALMLTYGDFQCPPDSSKSLERTAGALEYHFSVWPLDQDTAIPCTLPSGRRAIEFSFAEPLEIKHPVTGNPLIYCGRMDQIVDFAGGRYGEDDKTTSSLGPSWLKQWDLRSQFTGYCWAAAKAGIPLDGFLVRGISILKTKYDHAEVLTYRHPWMIERWYEQVHRDLARMIQCWETGQWDYNLDHSCTSFGACIFKQVCISKDPQPWLEGNYERRVWNPLERTETVLEV